MSWLDSLDEIKRSDWATAPLEERREKAREVVDICSYGGCLASVGPIPFADLAILLPVHSAMVVTVGHVFGRSITQTEAKRIALELGAVAGLSFAGAAAISAIKRLVLPGVGGLLTIPATFALTWALGRASIAYFEDPTLAHEDLKKVFEDAMNEGKSVFSPEAFERFRQRAGVETKKESRPPEPASAPPPESKAAPASPPPAPPPPADPAPKPAEPRVTRPPKRTL